MKLWFISAEDDDDGTNLDLFVWAKNLPHARTLWMLYYSRCGKWPTNACVWLVPINNKPKTPGAITWHKDIKDLQHEPTR